MSESTTASPNSAFVDTMSADDLRAERLLWWLAIAGAVVSVIVGILVLTWPRATLVVGAVLFGIWLLAHGVIRIVNALTASAEETVVRAFTGVIGLLFIIAGVICLKSVVVSLLTVATLIGVAWLITGIVELISAFVARGTEGRVLAGVLGAAAAIGGIVVLIWPALTLTTLVYLTGIWLVVMGGIQLLLVIRNRPWQRQGTRP